MANLSNVEDATFDAEVLQAQGPVLVDFGAEWCHPCRQLDPIVEELAKDWDGRVKVLTLDIDANPGTTMKLGIMGVPTLILFKGGQPIQRLMGYHPKRRILRELEPYLD